MGINELYDGPTIEKMVSRLALVLLEDSDKNIYRKFVDITEKILIEIVLDNTKGNKVKAARILGINRATLYGKINRLNIIWKEVPESE